MHEMGHRWDIDMQIKAARAGLAVPLP